MKWLWGVIMGAVAVALAYVGIKKRSDLSVSDVLKKNRSIDKKSMEARKKKNIKILEALKEAKWEAEYNNSKAKDEIHEDDDVPIAERVAARNERYRKRYGGQDS